MAKKIMKVVNQAALWLVAVGALNWLLVALLDFDIVMTILDVSNFTGVDTALYSLIGAAGIYIGLRALRGKVTVN